MMDDEINKLNELAEFLRGINRKILLLKLVNQAKDQYDQYNYEKAEEFLKSALDIEPNNAVSLRGLGCCAQFKGDFVQAEKLFLKALEFSKQKEIEYSLLGMVYYFQDKLDEAINYFNLAIDTNDSYDAAYEGRNQAMLENHLKVTDLQETLEKSFNKYR